jgi:thiamine biosynthesis lipoprotein
MSSPCAEFRRAQPLLGTVVSISAVAPDAAIARASVQAAFDAVARVHDAMSFHAPASALSRIHREAWREPVPVDPDTRRVLRAAVSLSRATDGLFDCTVARRLVAEGRLPRPEGAPAPSAGADWRAIDLSRPGCVALRAPVWIDLGGIAKGYALDAAAAALRAAGAWGFRVDAGGDLRIRMPEAEPVHVRHPSTRGCAFPVGSLRDGAVATSAPYQDDTGIWCGIVDPRTAVRRTDLTSVSVFAPRGLWADALTKVVMLAPELGAHLVTRLRATAVILRDDGTGAVCDGRAAASSRWSVGGGSAA